MTKSNHRTPLAASKRLTCAIYTRKSTEDGLEQEFNSLDAQRESGESYIKSQVGEGWECLADRYDDGGFPGLFRGANYVIGRGPSPRKFTFTVPLSAGPAFEIPSIFGSQ